MFDSRPRIVLTSDLDHTMVAHNDPKHESLIEFNATWNANCAADSKLIFSTGRSYHLYKELRSWAPMLTPGLLVCSVGTEILHFKPGSEDPVEDEEWVAHLSERWDRNAACQIAALFEDLVPQPDSEQRPFKISYHIKLDRAAAQDVCNRLQRQLESLALPAQVIFSGGVDVDILPVRAGKGNALAFILAKINETVGEPDAVLVCGDSGNDIELFRVPGVLGCMVSNAHEELRAFVTSTNSPNHLQATKPCASGIVEAMHHFELIPRVPCAQSQRMGTVVHVHEFFRKWFAGTIPQDQGTFAEFTSSQDPSFTIINPDGTQTDVVTLRDALFSLWGRDAPKAADDDTSARKDGDGGEADAPPQWAEADEVTWTHTWMDQYEERPIGQAVWLVAYDEWQHRGSGLPFMGRRCSALLSADASAPTGWRWLHVHETWLPGSGPMPMTAGRMFYTREAITKESNKK